jgi:hypothetical protein
MITGTLNEAIEEYFFCLELRRLRVQKVSVMLQRANPIDIVLG